jgi:hypothetical protein
MSQLRVKQIRTRLLGMFEKHLDLSDIPSHDKDRETKVLSRCLAALAIYVHAGCTEKEAARSVWDGADDNGIDAAHFDAGDSRVLMVQSKWISSGTGEPSAAEIGSFTKGVEDAIEQDSSGFHIRLKSRLSDIFARIATPGVSVHLLLATTGASHLATHGQQRINKLLNNLNGNDIDPIATSEVMGLSEVYNSLATDPLSTTVTLDANILDWSFVSVPYPAYFGIIDGLQLKEWWNLHGKRLVSRNIRHSLGATEVNGQIRQTVMSSPSHFWYFNNGITVIADQATKAPSGAASRSAGIFQLKGASIVNGAQTASTLAKITDDAKLGLVRVPFRVILLSGAPAGLGQDVARTNNFQNRIEPRDFVAQDQEQHRLRKEMSIEEIDYQFVRSDEHSSLSTTCDLIEVTTALACASGDLSLVVQIKTGVGRIFADLGRAPYKSLFNATVSGARAFNCTLVQRSIDNWIESQKNAMQKKSGTEWGLLVHGNRILAAAVFAKIPSATLEQPISTFRATYRSLEVQKCAAAILSKMVAAIKRHYPNNFLAVLFKNPSMSRRVYDLSIN